ncbi:dTDP-4-dehydrorhamnose 3,5-epimerase [Mucilaginibacter aquaedulcis]|uniref:dTDP-4-dehydrorhamnose 3,5-epimerase n=1 Tax=Mucilaginibacter aquaedulcis TaxID=1187081 RepID=UPI0025B4A5CF|nr:dTDP-4-dehydrorhamnose 3,5-epimerase [Mucilaginibacter aquaedulcis]MDN3549751.1 dTDP-4-dehydrorhamnose 3,5-epimerase [Mucilaginibacter aquaedulcis]
MNISKTPLEGCIILNPRVFNDERGYFFESFNAASFNQAVGYTVDFVQDNQSFSTKGVFRGLHLQKGENAQAKLVRVTQGKVLDVAVDLRTGSATYGQYYGVELSDENNTQFFIPRGFAHGFVVLSDTAVFQYKCDNYYNKQSEGGLHYADPDLAIDWKLPNDELLVSEKDAELPFLKDAPDFGF